MVEFCQSAAHEFCGLLRLAEHRIDVENVVARLVAVGILTDESGNVRRSLRALDYRTHSEERVEFLKHPFLASEAVLKPPDVVGSEPGVLPSVALTIVVRTMLRREWIEWCAPASTTVPSAKKTGAAVKVVLPRLAASAEDVRFRLFPKGFRCKSRCSVRKCILKVISHGFVHKVARNVAIFSSEVSSPLILCTRL